MFNFIKSGSKSHRKTRGNHWECIGRESFGKGDLSRVPPWVQKAIVEIRQKYGGTSSSLVEQYFTLKGKNYRYRVIFDGQGGTDMAVWRRLRNKKLRNRATVVAMSDHKVLLVRDKGHRRFSLPGGGVKHGEPSIATAARELYEETGLNCSRIERMFSYRGESNNHKVFLATPTGSPKLKDGELSQFIWWDGKAKIPVYRSVIGILKKMNWC